MIFLRKYLAALVEFSAGDTNILVFRRLCRENHLHRLQMDAVQFTQCGQKANNDRSRRGQAANRQTTLDDARQTNFQAVLFSQHLCSTTQMISPVTLLFIRHCTHKELSAFREVQRLQFHNTILFRVIGHVDSLVDCQTIDFSVLMVDMRTQWTDAVRAERYIKGFLMV